MLNVLRTVPLGCLFASAYARFAGVCLGRRGGGPAAMAPAKKPAAPAKGKKKQSAFIIDCAKPVEDKIMEIGAFEKFLLDKIKVNNKVGEEAARPPLQEERSSLLVPVGELAACTVLECSITCTECNIRAQLRGDLRCQQVSLGIWWPSQRTRHE